MSSVAVNDENHGVCPGRKHSGSSESSCDIFALDQPTGRPSILRQSQAENISNKSVPKGAKVCFQTPRRDPVTKRLVSPSKSARMSTMEDCTIALESLKLTCAVDTASWKSTATPPADISSSDPAPYPDDDMPIQSKGGYNFDFDNLDAMNPFQGSSQVGFSPTRPCVSAEVQKPVEQSEPEAAASPVEVFLEQPLKTDTALDETLPFLPSVENSITDLSTEIHSTDSSTVVIDMKNPGSLVMEQSVPDTEGVEIPKAAPTSASVPVSVPEDILPPLPVEESPLPPPKSSYTFDFDNLDLINPFQAGASKIQNSPPLGRKPSCVNSPPQKIEAQVSEPRQKEPELNLQILPVQEPPTQPEVKPTETSSILKETPEPSVNSPVKPSNAPPEDGPLMLEFNFDDGAEVKRKPPPKRFGKRPPGAKLAEKKNVPAEKKDSTPSPEPVLVSPRKPADGASPDNSIPVPKGSYSELDKFNDPDFNPFGTQAKMSNSPASHVKTSPVLKGKVEAAVQEPATAVPAEQVDQPAHNAEEKPPSSPPSTGNGVPKTEVADTSGSKEKLNLDFSPPKPDQLARVTPEPLALDQQNQNFQSGTLGADEEFVPGTTFMAGDFDGQMDYLEQFGSSTFKESALRKQSLYLKFDPLLRESPKKVGAAAFSMGIGLPRPSLAARMEAPKAEAKQELTGQKDYMKLLDFPAPAVRSLAHDPTVLDLMGPAFRQPDETDDAIIEVLKYSQKDMDAALAKVHKEAQEKGEDWKAQCDVLRQDNHQMGIIMQQFETTVGQIMAEHQQEREAAQAAQAKVLQEKEQVANDLNSLERSFSELLKRLDKHKEIIEGYKKNEETLKLCAQDYMARIKKEEQRYQSLKAHAEEKISLANGEIAEVRSKLKAEMSGLQIQLRREQLKTQSLEKSHDQKVKEVEELTKLCDELIVNVQKR